MTALAIQRPWALIVRTPLGACVPALEEVVGDTDVDYAPWTEMSRKDFTVNNVRYITAIQRNGGHISAFPRDTFSVDSAGISACVNTSRARVT